MRFANCRVRCKITVCQSPRPLPLSSYLFSFALLFRNEFCWNFRNLASNFSCNIYAILMKSRYKLVFWLFASICRKVHFIKANELEGAVAEEGEGKLQLDRKNYLPNEQVASSGRGV